MKFSILLPYKENFSPTYPGAVSLFLKDTIPLSKFKKDESYEEIDTRLASGWYVDALSGNNKKKYKTKEVLFKISKKSE